MKEFFSNYRRCYLGEDVHDEIAPHLWVLCYSSSNSTSTLSPFRFVIRSKYNYLTIQ